MSENKIKTRSVLVSQQKAELNKETELKSEHDELVITNLKTAGRNLAQRELKLNKCSGNKNTERKFT